MGVCFSLSGVDKFFLGAQLFRHAIFFKKSALKTKVQVQSKNNQKHCLLLIIKRALIVFISDLFPPKVFAMRLL